MFGSINNFSNQQQNSRISSNIISFNKNPFKIKRNYTAMGGQTFSENDISKYFNKKLKQKEKNQPESFIKNTKPRISEKLLREIEKYRNQTFAYSYKIKQCPCDE